MYMCLCVNERACACMRVCEMCENARVYARNLPEPPKSVKSNTPIVAAGGGGAAAEEEKDDDSLSGDPFEAMGCRGALLTGVELLSNAKNGSLDAEDDREALLNAVGGVSKGRGVK